ncbi:hypothetical protein [Ammoniphilus resinae]|uniref:Ferritin-like diiron domain-containing protein n=1 Tax=Ammoniphilus resinae TaxID=861532 RepID=A0ABS4GWE5_9BACL|nr:hypothetical protein [Ammoniphilus resinae]MBP1934591.1 hypothetical protein [Ammoniphilus resinae]
MEHQSANDITNENLKEVLQESLEMENELMRRYLITAERVHNNAELVIRLRNFAEGNAKRTRQLLDEIDHICQ